MSDRERHLTSVQKWLQDGEQLDVESDEECDIFGSSCLNDDELLASLYVVLENVSFHELLLGPICKQLFVLYNTRKDSLLRFVWSMLPPVVAVHLTTNVRTFHSASTTPVSSRPQCTDVLLLAIYNQEVVDEEGYLKQRVFRVPHLNRSSVYHEMRTGSATGTLSTGSTLLIGGQSDVFKRPDSVSSREVTVSAFGPYPEQDQINLANRNSIICALLKCFQDHLSSLPQSACAAFCRMCNRLLTSCPESGREDRWTTVRHDKVEPLNLTELMQKCSPRVQFTPNLLLQMLHCLYFCLYNGSLKEARHAVMEIHRRAMANLYSDVLLMTNAMLNSLEIPAGAKLDDECMRLSVALSPTSTNAQSVIGPGKAAITNASFKTQILPEDIPIVPHGGGGHDELNAINEEPNEDERSRNETAEGGKLSNRHIFSGGKEKRKEKKEKKEKEKSKHHHQTHHHSHHKYSNAGLTESNDVIALNVLHSTALNLESKGNTSILSATGSSLKSPNSASTGNLENALDQMRLMSSTGHGNEPPKSGSCVSDRMFNELENASNVIKGSLSSSASSENVVHMHPKSK